MSNTFGCLYIAGASLFLIILFTWCFIREAAEAEAERRRERDDR